MSTRPHINADGRNPLPRYELLEHTADLLVRYEAFTLPELFAVAARSLSEIMLGPDSVRASETHRVTLGPAPIPELFLDWLRELLYLFFVRGFCTADAELSISPESPTDRKCGTHPPLETNLRLSAMLRGEPFDPARHQVKLEIKTPTYHCYRLEFLEPTSPPSVASINSCPPVQSGRQTETPLWRAVVLFDV